MNRYKDLDTDIRLASISDEDYAKCKESVTMYFEGKKPYYQLPERLRIIIFNWENENINKEMSQGQGKESDHV